MRIPAGPDRPAIEIRVRRNADQGIVEVSTAEALPQSLTCAVELPSSFVEQFVIEDLDMDGNPDLRGHRDDRNTGHNGGGRRRESCRARPVSEPQ